MLVIEGADCLGKSTLAHAVAAKLGELQNCSAPPVHHLTKADSDMTVDQYARRCNPWTIYDRFHMSEYVYGSIAKDRKSNLSTEQVDVISGLVRAAGGLIVCVHCHNAVYTKILQSEHWNEEEQAFTRDECAKANSMYCANARQLGSHRNVRVTTSRLPHNGVDWPGMREILVEEIALQYVNHQLALGHGVPPDTSALRKERGMPSWVEGGMQSIHEAEQKLVSHVLDVHAKKSAINPAEYELIVEAAGGVGTKQYTRSYRFEKREQD